MIWIYRTDGEYFDKAATASEAAKITNNSPGNISQCLKGKLNQSKGFVFLYEKPGVSRMDISSRIEEYFRFNQMSLDAYLRQTKII